MHYTHICEGRFLARPNRFIAQVMIEGVETAVHVKNTGRCRELLRPGARVYLSESENPARKTRFDLIAVEKERPSLPPLLVNLDSQAPNEAAAQWLPTSGLFAPHARIRREVTLGNSRFDFCIEEGESVTWLEVKGVTLEEDGTVRFPDAPTERGTRHVRHLTALSREGRRTAILFVIQMEGMRRFRPNDQTDPAFGDALREAEAAGVRLLARECRVTPDTMEITAAIPIDTTRYTREECT